MRSEVHEDIDPRNIEKRKSDDVMERSEDDPIVQEGRSRRDRELETNLDHELHVQDFYVLDGAGISRFELEKSNLFGQSKRIHPEDEWMQRTWNHAE
jgi:hypothetical protein